MSTVHYLKTWPEYFNEVLSGRKPFEWRVDDRDFKLGDTLVLQEYIPHQENPGREGRYTGREIRKTVSYLFSPWATNKRTVVMAFAPLPDGEAVAWQYIGMDGKPGIVTTNPQQGAKWCETGNGRRLYASPPPVSGEVRAALAKANSADDIERLSAFQALERLGLAKVYVVGGRFAHCCLTAEGEQMKAALDRAISHLPGGKS